jgi:hypothetical protein
MDSVEQRREDLIARVKGALSSTGVTPAGYAKTLSNVLSISLPQAYRKLNGVSVFTMPQIEAIESAYGIELMVVPSGEDERIPKGVRTFIEATFAIGDYALPCQIILGTARKAPGHRFSAFLKRGQWYVCVPGDYAGSEPLFDVLALHLNPDE